MKIHDFGGPNEMALMWMQTRLNIHASLYESYGMVPIEASAFSVPTICHTGDVMGFCDLLLEKNDEVYRTNFKNKKQAVLKIMELLGMNDSVDGDGEEEVVEEEEEKEEEEKEKEEEEEEKVKEEEKWLRATKKLCYTSERARDKALSWNVQAFAR